jgi:Fe-Mn family superoxide dismutase
MKRREFIRLSLSAAALAMFQLSVIGCKGGSGKTALIPLPELPYDDDSLAPYISKNTLHYHFGSHHKGYVDKANHLMENSQYGNMTIEQVIRKSHTEKSVGQSALFNNVAQVYNHAFYWNSLRPDGGGEPTGVMMTHLESSFGSYRKFRDAFEAAATSQFASGWVWLVFSKGTLSILNTPNAINPLVSGQVPLLTLDLWEHAYYLDYQNRRDEYVTACLDHLLNWEFAAANMGETV